MWLIRALLKVRFASPINRWKVLVLAISTIYTDLLSHLTYAALILSCHFFQMWLLGCGTGRYTSPLALIHWNTIYTYNYIQRKEGLTTEVCCIVHICPSIVCMEYYNCLVHYNMPYLEACNESRPDLNHIASSWITGLWWIALTASMWQRLEWGSRLQKVG